MGAIEKDFEGLLVIELASILAGPSVGMFFAELGAKVLKIENLNTRGDATRGWKVPAEDTDTDVSSYFSSVNWGKSSLGLDLKKPEGREVIYDLIRKADVVLQSYKPGDEVKLGLDYETLRDINPRLICAQINAYGPDDPRVGFDAIIQAESGFTYLNGEADGGPTKMPVALVDILLAHQLKEGILLALLKRFRTGEGSLVVASLLKAAVASLANQAANWLVAGVIPQRLGSEHPNIVPYGTIFPTSEGRQVVIAVGTDRQFEGLLEILQLDALKQDARFAGNFQRVKNRSALNEILAAPMARLSAREIDEGFRAKKIPFGFVNNMKEVFEQDGAKEMILEGELPEGRAIRGVRSISFEGDAIQTKTVLSAPPHFNQHGEQILREVLDYSGETIARLKRAGVIA